MSASIPERVRSKKFSVLRNDEGRTSPRPLKIGVLDEETFLKLLRLERKRAERSGRRFVLMLLEAGSLLRTSGDGLVLDTVLGSLLESTRETDLKGWYERNSIFGVIFTEIEAEGGVVLKALLSKVSNALCTALSVEQVNEIKLSFHIFPEGESEEGSGGIPDFVFYKDLVQDLHRNSLYHHVKRSMDVAGSLLGLIVLAPLFLAIAIAIKVGSKGPILFKQERIGQFYERFTFLKFRSMYVNSDHRIHREYVEKLIAGDARSDRSVGNGQNVYKITNDPRITPVGRFLRRTSLDELPQLVNVLKGEMTLVGPRPCIAYEFRRYDPWHRRRLLAVKPGITGLWQVAGRSRVKFDEMVRLDLEYAEAHSIWLDLKILLHTPGAVFSGAGAY